MVGHVHTPLIHSRWIRPDTTLGSSRHDKQARMSRHNRAQTTPTHASGFHLFTVEWQVMQRIKGFSYRSKYQICRCCPNAVKESRSERVGFYRNEQGGFCLPGTSEDNIESSSVSTITSSVQRLPRGEQHRQTQKKHNQCKAQYDACYDMAIWMCFGLMHLATS